MGFSVFSWWFCLGFMWSFCYVYSDVIGEIRDWGVEFDGFVESVFFLNVVKGLFISFF